MDTCHICAQIAGDATNDLISQLLHEPVSLYVRRIPIENDVFAVIPSLGPLLPGHVLICPKRHVKSTALLEVSLRADFDNFKCLVKDKLKGVYAKEVHCFEHGNAKVSSTPLCTVEHAHLHAFPASVTDFLSQTDRGIPWLRLEPRVESISHIVKGREYLYYEPPIGQAYVAITEGLRLGSQYFRKVISKGIGNYDLWNWRTHQSPGEAEVTFSRLADLNSRLRRCQRGERVALSSKNRQNTEGQKSGRGAKNLDHQKPG